MANLGSWSERSPSLTSSLSSRSSSPSGPRTPAIGSTAMAGQFDSENSRKGGNAVLARQQALLERTSSTNGLSRRGSVQNMKTSFNDASANKNDRPFPGSFSRAHSPASHSVPRSAAISDRYRPQSPETSSTTSTPRQSRVPLSTLPNSSAGPKMNYGSSTSSAPSTPSHRVSRFNSTSQVSSPRANPPPTKDLDAPASWSSPMARSRSADSAPEATPPSIRTRTQSQSSSSLYRVPSLDRSHSPSLSNPSTPTGYSSVVSASQRSTHRYTRSLESSPSIDHGSPAPSEMNNHYHGGGGHSRRALDRLSEHWDQEGPLLDEQDMQPASPSPSSHRPLSPMTFGSPDIDRQKEIHMPGYIDMHRGKGASGRVVLARKATVSAGGWVLPSNSVRAMDISRHHVVAYEYLSHVAEYAVFSQSNKDRG